MLTALAVPLSFPATTKRYIGLAPELSAIIEAETSAPELLIASLNPCNVSLLESTVMLVDVEPTVIFNVPCWSAVVSTSLKLADAKVLLRAKALTRTA